MPVGLARATTADEVVAACQAILADPNGSQSIYADGEQLKACLAQCRTHLGDAAVQPVALHMLARLFELYDTHLGTPLRKSGTEHPAANTATWLELVTLVVETVVRTSTAPAHDVLGHMLRCLRATSGITRRHITISAVLHVEDPHATPPSSNLPFTRSSGPPPSSAPPAAAPNTAAEAPPPACLPWLTLLATLTDPTPSFWSWASAGAPPRSVSSSDGGPRTPPALATIVNEHVAAGGLDAVLATLRAVAPATRKDDAPPAAAPTARDAARGGVDDDQFGAANAADGIGAAAPTATIPLLEAVTLVCVQLAHGSSDGPSVTGLASLMPLVVAAFRQLEPAKLTQADVRSQDLTQPRALLLPGVAAAGLCCCRALLLPALLLPVCVAATRCRTASLRDSQPSPLVATLRL